MSSVESVRERRLLVCSDVPTFGRGIKSLMSGFQVVAADLGEVDVAGFEVVVWHQKTPPLNHRLRHLAVVVPTVAVTDESALIEAVEMGCRGFVGSHASLEETATAIATVARGEAYVPPLMLGSLLRHIVEKQRAIEATPGIDELTTREREVFDLASGGSSRADIAERLFISQGTVRSHLQSVYKKIGVHTQAELIALASGARNEHE